MNPQEIMEAEYNMRTNEAMFRTRLRYAAEQGLLLFVKYALVILLAYATLVFSLNVINGANNGTQAALYLNQLQSKGWLPKIQNGIVPEKTNEANLTLK